MLARAGFVLLVAALGLILTAVASWAQDPGPPPPASYPLEPYRLSDGSPVCDAAGQSPPQGDIVCDTAGNSIYVGSDGTTVTMAINFFEDPRIASQQAPFNQVAYTVQVAVGGVHVASFGIDGKKTGNNDAVYAKCVGASTLTYERNLSSALAEGDVTITTVPAPDPPGGLAYQVRFVVPLSALAPCGVTTTTPIAMFVGSSQAGNLDVINKDLMTDGTTIDFGAGSTVSFEGQLALDKAATHIAGPNPPQNAQTTTYDLVVTASAQSIYDLTTVAITDTLPDDVTIVSTSASTGSVTQTGQTIDWSFPLLEPANDQTLTIRVTITPDSGDVGSPFLLNPGASGTAIRSVDSEPLAATSPSVSTAPVAGPALGIAKTASPTSVSAGGTVTYTVTISSTGTVPATFSTVTDTLPAGFAFVPGSTGGTLGAGAPSVAGQTITWSGAFSIPAGESRTLTFDATAAIDGGNYDNRATASGGNAGTVATGPTATVTVTGIADLAITKSASPVPLVAGSTATYTITVTNAGPSAADAVTVTDTLPAGTTFSSASAGCAEAGGTVTCSLGMIASGGSSIVTITVLVDASATGSIANTATVTSTTADPAPGNESATDTSPVSQVADLDLDMTAPASTVTGTNADFTVTTTNLGPSDATNVVVVAPLPASVTFVAVDDPVNCSYDAGTHTVTCTYPSLAAAGSATATITVGTDPAGTGTLSVSASTSSDATDPDASNDSAAASTTLVAEADLSTTKTAPGSVVAGTNLTYTVTVTNTGPSTATGVSVTDPLPAGTTFVSASAGCGHVAGTVTCALGDLGPGASTSVTITVAVDPAQTSDLTNTATASSAVTDPDPSDDSGSVTTTVTTSADLGLTKTGPASVVAGTNATYTLTVTNSGPSDATGVVVTDAVPAGTTFVSASAGCSEAGGIVTCSAASLAAGGSTSFTVTFAVDASSTGTVTNTASVSATTTDPVAANDTATATSAITTSADLSATVTAAPAPVTAGETLTITGTVSSAGPSDATGVELTFPIPAGATFVSAPAGCTYDAGTDTVTCTAGTLAPGGSASFDVVVRVDPSTTVLVTSTATASALTPDPDASNDTGGTSTSVATSADLSTTKTAAPEPVTAGTPLAYTVTVSNAGPSDAAGVTVTDALPAEVTFTSASAGCTYDAGSHTVTCTLGTVAAGASRTLTITTGVDPATTTSITNTATATATTPDPDGSNDAGSTTSTVTASADLVTALADSPDPVVAGESLTWTATVTNAGPSVAAAATVTLPLPAGTTFVSADPGCTHDAGTNTVTCVLGDLAPGASVSPTITVAVDPAATGTITATATAASTTPDPTPANDAASQTTSISVENDLLLSLSDAPDPVTAGTSYTVSATVTSTGPSDAPDVEVVLALPAGTTFVSAPPGCTYDAGAHEVTCVVGTLPAGSTTTLDVVVGVPASTAGGSTLTTSGTVTTSALDPVAGNDSASVVTSVSVVADVAVGLVDAPDPVVAGTGLTWTVSVSNLGPSDAAGVVASLPLPAGVVFVSAPGCVFDAGTGTVSCAVGTLAAGGSTSFVVDVTVGSSVTGSVSATASVVSSSTDPVAANDAASASTVVTASSDLVVGLVAAPDPVVAGEDLTYTVSVSNTGPSDATGVEVSFALPAGTTLVSAPAGCTLDVATQVVTCVVGSVAAGGAVSLPIVVAVDPSQTADLSASASVTSTTPDPDPSDNSASATTTVTTSADLAVTVVDTPDPVAAGDPLTYTVTATNTGPSDATGVVTTLALPAGTTFVSASAGCTEAAGTVTCTIGDLAAGDAASSTITVLTDPLAPGTLTATGTVSTTTTDPTPGNDTATVTTTAAPRADVGIVLTDAPDPATAGAGLTYTMTITANGPSLASDVTATLALPAEVAFDTAPAGCAYDGATHSVICAAGDLAPLGTASFAIDVIVDPSTVDGSTLVATATVTTTAADNVPANDTSVTTTTTRIDNDLVASKTASPEPVTAGTNLTYTLGVTNAGPSDAPDITITDTLPAGVTFVSADPGCAFDGLSTVTCTASNIPALATVSFTVTVTVDSSTTGTLTNSATVSGSATDPVPANDTATVSSTVVVSSDLALSVAASPDPVVAGSDLTYTMTISNTGPSDATGVVSSDPLPAGVTFVSADPGCTYDAGTRVVTCAVGTLVAGGSLDLDIVVATDPSLDPAVPLVNILSVSSSSPDPDLSDNTATSTVTVTAEADLGITLTDVPDPVVAGTPLSYDLSVSNLGPSTARAVTATLTLPAGVTFASAGPACLFDGLVTVTCTFGDLAPGGTTTEIVTVTVAPDATGPLSATSSATTTTTDPVAANDTSVADTTVDRVSDLGVSLSATPDPVVAGTPLTYTATVTNAGPSTGGSTELEIALPAGLSVSAPLPAGCAYDAGANTVTCDAGDLPPGSTASFTFDADVSSGATGTLSTTASATTTSTDPDPTDDSASMTTAVATEADLVLTLVDSPDPVVAGETLTYTLTATNAGPSDATATTLTFPIPAGATFVSADPGCTHDAGTDTVTCALGPLTAGVGDVTTIVVSIDSATTGTVDASASLSSTTPDPTPADRSASASTTVDTSADLAITKTASPATAVAGAPLTYTLTVSNAGPSDALTVVVTDLLPAEATFVSASAGCSLTAPGTVTCNAASIPAGASRSFTISVTVAPTASGSITNDASVTSATADPDPGNDSTSLVTPVIASSDLVVAISDAPDPATAGLAATYTVDVTNVGPSTAADATVTLAVPLGMAPGTLPGGCAYDAGTRTVTCTLAAIAPGDTASLAIELLPNPNTSGSVSVTAAVTSTTPDPDASNNSATEATTVVRIADLVAGITDTPDPVLAGATLQYVITATNAGPSTASGVVLTHTLPAGVTVSGVAAGCTYDAATHRVSCTVGTLAPSTASSFFVDVTVPATASGTLTSSVRVTGSTADPDATNDTAAATTTVDRQADLSLSATDSPDPVDAGTDLTTTVTVTNTGPATATDTEVTISLPAETTFASADPGCTYDAGTHTVTCDLGDLAPDAAETITVVATVDSGTPAGTILVTDSSVTSTTPDPDATNDTATSTTTVAIDNDLAVSLVDSPDPVIAGTTLTYTLATTNSGPSDATGVVLTQALPTGVAVGPLPVGCTEAAGTVTCTVGTLGPGATATFDIVVDVDPATTGVLSSTATVAASVPDAVPANDTTTTTTTVIRRSDVQATITPDATSVTAGSPLGYTFTVTNLGPSSSSGVAVTDPLPPDVSLVALDPACTYDSGTRIVSCPVGTLAPGDSATFTLDVLVSPTAIGAIANTISATSTSTDPDPSNNVDTAVVTVVAEADLRLSLTDAPDPATAGESLTYTATVTNDGPSSASGVVLTMPLPVELAPGPLPAGCTFDAGSSTITCALGDLAAGDTATVVVPTVIDPSAAGVLTTTASVTSTATDPDPSDDSATATTNVGAEADLAVSLADSPDPATAGEPITYVLTVSNLGPSTSTDPEATLTLPPGVTFTSASAGCAEAGGVVTCTAASLASGDTISFTVTAAVVPGATGAVTAGASVSSPTLDPEPANDATSATTTVTTSADLSTTLVASPTPAVAGEDLTYTATVSNVGPSDAVAPSLVLALPPDTTFVSAPAGCAYDAGSHSVTCTLADLAPGDAAAVGIVVAVDPAATGSLTATADASSPTPDPDGDASATAVTAVTTSADLALTITDAPDPVTAGGPLTYTLVADNAGPSTATGVVATLSLPPGVTVTSAPGCLVDAAAGTVTCDLGDISPSSSASAVVDVTVGPSVSGTITADGEVESTTPDPDPSNDTDAATTTVAAAADLSASISANPDPLVAGGSAVHVLTITNAGPSTATDPTFETTLPPELTLTSLSAGCTFDGVTRILTCTAASLLPGESVSFTVQSTLDPATTGTVDLTGTASSSTADPDLTDNTASSSTGVVGVADLVVGLSDAPDPVDAGTDLTLTATVTNDGPSTATAAALRIPLPAGTTFVSAPGCLHDAVTNTVNCDLGDLAPGSVTTVDVTATVGAGVPAGTLLSTTASVTTSATDPDGANDSDTTITTVAADNDLVLSVSDVPDPVTAGEQLTYRLTLTNTGPSDATDVVLTQSLPAGVTVASLPASCTESGGTVTCTLGTVPAATVLTVDVVVDVDPATLGTVTSTASVTSTSPDSVPGNNDVTATTTVRAVANLSIDLIADSDPVVAGTPLTYTLTAANAGPSTSTGVATTDPLPANVTFVSAAPGCTYDAATRTVACDVGSLAPGDSTSFDIVVLVDPSATGTVANTVDVTATTTDPDPTDNSATLVIAVVTEADLRATLTATPEPVLAGEELVYRATINNDGPSDADAATITLSLPADVTVTGTLPSGCTLDAGTNVVTCAVGDLPAGSGVTFTVRTVVDAAATGPLPASATAASGTTDPDPSDDTATTSTTVIGEADLRVAVTTTPDPVTAGTSLAYDIDVTNGGPSDAADVEVTVELPAGTTFVSADPGCTYDAAAHSVTCVVGTLTSGATASMGIVVDVAPDVTSALVTDVTASSTTSDPTPGDSTVTETTAVTASADVSVSLTAAPEPVLAGETLAYTLGVANAGPSTAVDVVVLDALPVGVTFSSASPGCTYDAGSRLVTCTIAALGPGGAATFDVTVVVGADRRGTITNEASITSATPDPDVTDDRAIVVSTIAERADLSLAMDLPATGVAGEPVLATLTVTNSGPSTASSATVTTDPLPAGVSVGSLPTGCSFDAVTRVVTCAVGDVAPGVPVTLDLELVPDPEYRGDLTVVATLASPTADPDPSGNTASGTVDVTAMTAMSVTLDASPDPVVPGESLTVTAVARNDGPSTARSTVLVIDLPDGFGPLASVPAGCVEDPAARTLTCALGDLPPGAAVEVSFSGLAAPDLVDPLEFTATLTSLDSAPVPGVSQVVAQAPVSPSANLSVTATATLGADGRTIVQTVAITNAGPSVAVGTVLVVELPVGTTLVSADPRCSLAGTTLTCAVGDLGPGEGALLEIVLRADDAISGELTTLVSATALTADPDLSDNDATATVTVLAVAPPPLPRTGANAAALLLLALALVAAGARLRRVGVRPATEA